MKLSEYLEWTRTTAVYPSAGERNLEALTYVTLGVTNEVGEVAGKVKKIHRGDKTLSDSREALLDELGDSFWYFARILDELGTDIPSIMERNFRKLEDRKAREVLKGDGDTR